MAFIRAFIRREARIAVDAVCAVLCGEVAYGGVELGKAFDELVGEIVELRLCFLVFGLVGVEPFALDVPAEPGKDWFDGLHVVRLSFVPIG